MGFSGQYLKSKLWDILENIEQPKYATSWKILNNPNMRYPGKYWTSKYGISWKILNNPNMGYPGKYWSTQLWDILENIEQPNYGISWKILNIPIIGYPGIYMTTQLWCILENIDQPNYGVSWKFWTTLYFYWKILNLASFFKNKF